MEQDIIFVGLDVHKDTIVVALAESGRRGEVRQHGKIANTPANLKGLAGKLSRSGRELRALRLRHPASAGRCGP